MSLYDLLPPNSSQLERDLSRAVSFLPKLESGPPVVRTAKRYNYPASVLPWLVYEYGLGELSEHFDSLGTLIDEGVAWQRIRGTPTSVELALGWLGLDAAVDESEAGSYKWSEFQVDAGGIPSDATTRSLIFLAEVSSPVRSRVNRVYHGYDFRRFVLDDSPLSGGAILSDHSGVRPAWANGAQLSFGRLHDGLVILATTVLDERSAERDGVAALLDTWRLDFSILGGTDAELTWHTLNEPASRETERSGFAGGKVDAGAVPEWDGAWADHAWVALPWGGSTLSVADGLHDSTS